MAAGAVAAAGGPIGIALAGVGMGVNILGSLLKGHSIRLADAKNENAAANQAIPAFIKDIQDVATAYNSGQESADNLITYIEQMEQSIKTYLQSQVGKPGTSWVDNPNFWTSTVCNKSCTVGCCLFQYVQRWTLKVVTALQSGTAQTVSFSSTSSSKYGYSGTPAFSITLAPPGTTALASQILGAPQSILKSISNFLGFSTPVAATNSNLMPTPTSGLTKLLLYGGIILLAVVALFSSKK